jgi:tRNA/tmRNA/rRNA uracil-C5-methylase (TrmA/RlmC/RlmD family)
MSATKGKHAVRQQRPKPARRGMKTIAPVVEETLRPVSFTPDPVLAAQYAAHAREQMRVEIDTCEMLLEAMLRFASQRVDANALRSTACDSQRPRYQKALHRLHEMLGAAVRLVEQEMHAEGIN